MTRKEKEDVSCRSFDRGKEKYYLRTDRCVWNPDDSRYLGCPMSNLQIPNETGKIIYGKCHWKCKQYTYKKLNCQRSVFPSLTALLKALYLSTLQITKMEPGFENLGWYIRWIQHNIWLSAAWIDLKSIKPQRYIDISKSMNYCDFHRADWQLTLGEVGYHTDSIFPGQCFEYSAELIIDSFYVIPHELQKPEGLCSSAFSFRLL